MSSELENRMRLIEEKYEYQDRTVEMLNQVLIQQQAQIDKLELELGRIKEDIIAANMDVDEVNDTMPPHY